MNDQDLLNQIREFMEEEQRLRDAHSAGDTPLDATERQRLRDLEEHLDQCWDLLRQRRAARSSVRTRTRLPNGRRRPSRSTGSDARATCTRSPRTLRAFPGRRTVGTAFLTGCGAGSRSCRARRDGRRLLGVRHGRGRDAISDKRGARSDRRRARGSGQFDRERVCGGPEHAAASRSTPKVGCGSPRPRTRTRVTTRCTSYPQPARLR